MPKIVSSTELRNAYNEVSSWCHHSNEPAFITKNGTGDLAVMSMQAYDEFMARIDMYEFIEAGRRDVLAGNTAPAREHIDDLRKKHVLQ